MGWLGWTPEAALAADVNLILLALEGREDMLKAIFGDASEGKGKKGPVTANRWRHFAAGINERFRGRRK